ncbi:hypothetical protein TNCV_5080671 [Trichonephila clavipes]|nr:hypothetical protein TNCV_5080671 [Trichonephila clavipes]
MARDFCSEGIQYLVNDALALHCRMRKSGIHILEPNSAVLDLDWPESGRLVWNVKPFNALLPKYNKNYQVESEVEGTSLLTLALNVRNIYGHENVRIKILETGESKSQRLKSEFSDFDVS